MNEIIEEVLSELYEIGTVRINNEIYRKKISDYLIEKLPNNVLCVMCDDNNNTDYIIDNNYIIVDILLLDDDGVKKSIQITLK
jgi:hypothetical protein